MKRSTPSQFVPDTFLHEKKWSSFLAYERQEAKNQYGNDNYKGLTASPAYPIIVLEGKEVIDGNHRVALALERGQKTIPAIVGKKIR